MIEDKKLNKYNIGKIYTIRCYNDDKLIYVGSTVQPLYKAWNEHKSTHKNENSKKYNKLLYVKMREIGIDSFYIELHENCNCNCIEELKKKVGEIIRNIGTLNKTIYGREQKNIDNLLNIKNTLKNMNKHQKEKNIEKNTLKNMNKQQKEKNTLKNMNKHQKEKKQRKNINKNQNIKNIRKNINKNLNIKNIKKNIKRNIVNSKNHKKKLKLNNKE